MFTDELTKASPDGSAFTLTERTLVQGGLMGAASDGSDANVFDRAISKVIIEKEKTDGGTDFRSYGLEIKEGKPQDFYLGAGTYQTHLEGAQDNTYVKVHLTPVDAD